MPRSRLSLPLSLVLALMAPAAGRAGDDGPADAGPIALFNGKDLSGWKPVGGEGKLRVRDGLLVLEGDRGWLVSEKSFGDFELRLVYRFATPQADSAVLIRADLEAGDGRIRAYQVRNADGPAMGRVDALRLPISDVLHAREDAQANRRAPGEWNEMVILAKGPVLIVTSNGAGVGSATIRGQAGHVGLQAGGGTVEFRTVELQPLE